MTPGEIKKLVTAINGEADSLVNLSDGATERFVLAIQRAETRLFAKIAALISESPDLSSLSVKARLKWYMDNALGEAKMLKATGYTKAAQGYVALLKEIADQASLTSRAAAPAFTDVPAEFVQFMQERTYEHLNFLGSAAIDQLDTSLLEMSVGGYTHADMLDELKATITGEYPWGDRTGLYEWHAGTYVRTSAQRSAQLFMNYQAERYGLGNFIYVGPMDSKTRPFCRRLLGNVYSRDEIDKMDNGQTMNTFATCGGFNCRHKWVAVSNEVAGAVARLQLAA
jgi:hypothetical protein